MATSAAPAGMSNGGGGGGTSVGVSAAAAGGGGAGGAAGGAAGAGSLSGALSPTGGPNPAVPNSIIRAFLVYRPLAAQDEGAGLDELYDKVLYYYPPSTHPGQQVQEVTFAEGLLDFCSTFNPTEPLKAVRLQKSMYCMHQCEPSLWMVFVYSNPSSAGAATAAAAAGGDSTAGDGGEVFDEDTAYQQVQRCWALYSFLFGGVARVFQQDKVKEAHTHIQNLRKEIRKLDKFDGEEPDSIPAKIAEQMPRLPMMREELAQLTATSAVSFVRATLSAFMPFWLDHVEYQLPSSLCDFEGVQYFPVYRPTYLTIQQFMNHVRLSSPAMEHIAVLFDSRLVATTVAVPQLILLQQYLRFHAHISALYAGLPAKPLAAGFPPPTVAVSSMNGVHIGMQCVGRAFPVLSTPSVRLTHEGHVLLPMMRDDGFLGPEGPGGKRIHAPGVYLDITSPIPTHYLLWYQHDRASVLVLVKNTESLPHSVAPLEAPDHYFRHSVISGAAGRLDAVASEHCAGLHETLQATLMRVEQARASAPKEFAKVIYMNTMNCAFKLLGPWPSYVLERKKRRPTELDGAVYCNMLDQSFVLPLQRVIQEARQRFAKDPAVQEYMVRSKKYGTVICRTFLYREVYVILEPRAVHIVDAYGKINEMMATQFGNICSET